ncbi:MAG: DUF1800 domain-containing protein [bacterium]
MRNHILDRTGYGWDEWTRARIATLGVQGYINEQLSPASIDESTNTELNNRRAALGTLDRVQELQGLDLINAVYARRQLEEQVAMFWTNHFNTDYRESTAFFGVYQNCAAYTDCVTYPDCCNLTRPQKSTQLHYLDVENFRDLAFNGSFREILEESALGPAMIIYLDTNVNVRSAPNENFARELLELHTLGVTGGYTQQDIVELARVFTGWNVCKKTDANAGDPLAACIPNSQIGQVPPTPANKEPAGQWVANFRPNQHDNGQKILFQGTDYQKIIPATPLNSSQGINDAYMALDDIVAHPSAPAFIAKKLLQKFVTETPTQAMIDAVVAEWNDPTNPNSGTCSGTPLRCQGDLREVLRAVLAQAELLNPDQVHEKIKTPFEHVASSLRATRGKTDGFTGVLVDPLARGGYLSRMQELFHQNPVPTGYSELGGDWVDTGNLLERQNWGMDLTSRTATNYGNDIIGLLQANGIPTTPGTPANAPAIVDFFTDVLFGGALTPAERQDAIDYLTTDDNGVPTNFNDARIRETVGFLMGYAQFLEQ